MPSNWTTALPIPPAESSSLTIADRRPGLSAFISARASTTSSTGKRETPDANLAE